MFDLDFSKLALIGVVALVVLGPERLPRVARTAGTLLGRAQRYLNDVKAEVSREIELDELRRAKTGFETAAAQVQNTIHNTVKTHTTELTDAWNNGAVVTQPVDDMPAADPVPTRVGATGAGRTVKTVARRNWRAQRNAVPAWYKQANQKRQSVLSKAGRQALAARQDTSASSGRRPIRFL